MTVDFQLAHGCPHLAVEERVPLADDRRSLLTRQPVTSGDFVQILVNDLDVIPREGLLSFARVEGSFAGPFTIRKGRNTLSVTNSESTIQVELPVGSRVPADRLVAIIDAAFRNAQLNITVLSRNGALVFLDVASAGPESRILVRGLAAESLGFSTQVGAKGKMVYPGWTMASREDTVNTVNINQFVTIRTRFPQFVQPIKQGNPVFKVTYATTIQRCRRCQMTGIENDYRFDQQGFALLVENEDLLNQNVLKILLTDRGSNPFHTFYGSILRQSIGQKAIRGTASNLQEDVRTTLKTLQNLQEVMGRYQSLTARERLAFVISVSVVPSPRDPTVFFVNITGTNASGEPVNLTTVFAVPGTAALVGSNGLSLGLEGFGLNPNLTASEIFG